MSSFRQDKVEFISLKPEYTQSTKLCRFPILHSVKRLSDRKPLDGYRIFWSLRVIDAFVWLKLTVSWPNNTPLSQLSCSLAHYCPNFVGRIIPKQSVCFVNVVELANLANSGIINRCTVAISETTKP